MIPQAEIDAAVKKVNQIAGLFIQHRQRVAALGGAYMAAAIESAAPRSTKPHSRYSTPKAAKRLRAPKGMGIKVATYYPGNLGRSIQVMKFRQAPSKVYVGAKLAKGSATGVFRNRRVDGYYLAIVESKRPFYVAASKAAENRTIRIMTDEWKRVANKYERDNAIK